MGRKRKIFRDKKTSVKEVSSEVVPGGAVIAITKAIERFHALKKKRGYEAFDRKFVKTKIKDK